MVTGMRKQAVMLNMAACSNLNFSSGDNSETYCLEGFIGFLASHYAQKLHDWHLISLHKGAARFAHLFQTVKLNPPSTRI